MTHDQHDDQYDDKPTTASKPHGRRPAATPTSADEWRELLRKEDLPDDIAELPRRKRRRAAKHWRSARRLEREQAVRAARGKAPVTLAVPALALLLAGAVAAGTWLWPDHEERKPHAAPPPTASAAAPGAPETTTPPSPAASASANITDPDKAAEGFATAYSTRLLMQDATHAAAVQRAAPYASDALVANLKNHDDRDWNKLVAAQAREAKPTKTVIAKPTDKQRPAPDTDIRIWRQATVTVAVTGTDGYSYTREMTIEVSRADIGTPWMVTRVLGLEE
ncbi:hypothetical protein ACIQU4_28305 [Streptomyces sp. NPDC090741]|uniref:hypothetical protein n=1 Tax=Streptomyces sp. NPDC090741 TaxID=3365967 RepID=UPI00381C304B